MKIGPWDLHQKVLLVAEIGNNHEGDFRVAGELIRKAAKAGADAVKFQTIIPEKLVSRREEKRLEQLKKFRLSYEEFEKLSRLAKEEGVLFLSTPFDIESARFLNRLVPAFKIASGDNNFYPLIRVIAETGKPILLSSGLADLTQVEKTKSFIEEIWKQKGIRQELAVLHCVASYPTERSEANLGAIRELQKLKVTVGYSDHTLGIEAAVLSVALGARIIEKHFTLAKGYSDFHDHKISANPAEFQELARRVRETVEYLGTGIKRIQESEKKNVEKARRSIVTNHGLEKGRVLTREDLGWVRPAGGLAPGEEDKILGKTLRRSLEAGEPIRLSDVE